MISVLVFRDSDLCMNPLISPNVYNQFRSEEKWLIFDYLFTPNASIKQLKSQIMWLKQFETLAEEKIISSDGLPEGKLIDVSILFGVSIPLFSNVFLNYFFFKCFS